MPEPMRTRVGFWPGHDWLTQWLATAVVTLTAIVAVVLVAMVALTLGLS